MGYKANPRYLVSALAAHLTNPPRSWRGAAWGLIAAGCCWVLLTAILQHCGWSVDGGRALALVGIGCAALGSGYLGAIRLTRHTTAIRVAAEEYFELRDLEFLSCMGQHLLPIREPELVEVHGVPRLRMQGRDPQVRYELLPAGSHKVDCYDLLIYQNEQLVRRQKDLHRTRLPRAFYDTSHHQG